MRPLRILNLEDSPLDAEIMQTNLFEGGIDHEITRVQTRADFAAALEEDGFDLILSDFALPSFDGLSALEMSRETRPEIPFIIISGTLGEEAAIEFIKSGATDYVLKHRLERLVPAVRRAISEADQKRERKETEEALRRSEERFRHLVEQAADAMFAHDLEGRFVDVNRRACESLGYTREELLAMRVPDVEMNYEPGCLPRLWTKIGPGEPRTLEGIHRRKDGTSFPVEVRVGVFESEGRRLMLALARDVTERKRAEEMQRKSEERFRSLVQNASDIVMILDAGSNILYESPAVERVLGFDPEERIGLNVFDHVHPDDAAAVKPAWAEFLEKPGDRMTANYRLLDKSGSWHHFEAITTNLLHDPIIRGIVVNSRDVTDRKRVDEALKESEERFRLLSDAALEGIILSEEGVLLDANESFLSMFDYELDEVLGEPVVKFVAPEDREFVERTCSSGDSSGYEVQGLRSDDTLFPIEVRPRRIPYRKREARITSILDLTERREAEVALKRGEALYRTVIQQAAEIIFLGDFETARVLEANAAFYRSLGYTPEQLERMTISDFIVHAPGEMDRYAQRVMEERQLSLGEKTFRCKDGSLIDVEVNISVVPYGDREVQCVVAHDVTVRKRAEENLRQSLSVLLALREAGQILSSTLESEEIVSRLLEIMQRVSNLTATVISVRDEDGRARIWRSVGLEGLWPRARFAPQAEAARLAALETQEDQTFRLRNPDSETEHVVGLCLPLRTRDRVIGVLEAYGPASLAKSETAETLISLASQAASALENAQLYGELGEREHRLQTLVGRLLGAQEEERRRVAYEVHDGLAQVAVAAHQHLQAFARRHSPNTERSRSDLERVSRLVRQTVSDARKIIANLRPTALDDFGLAAAVSLEVERLREDGYRIDYEEELGVERLPTTAEIALFRVAQEALTNMRKHAETRRVSVELRRKGDEARLVVRDYGRGFDASAASTGSGPGERIGLAGMQERIGMLGGTLEIHSQPGAGTTVTADINLTQVR